jgi:hypothetical protein
MVKKYPNNLGYRVCQINFLGRDMIGNVLSGCAGNEKCVFKGIIFNEFAFFFLSASFFNKASFFLRKSWSQANLQQDHFARHCQINP